jgi:hypothetical protein
VVAIVGNTGDVAGVFVELIIGVRVVTLVVHGVVLTALSSLQVGQYVMYQNMTEMWSCVVPVLSQNASEYEEGVQFPACAYFQYVPTQHIRALL